MTVDAFVFVTMVAALASLALVPRPRVITVRRRVGALPSLAVVRAFRGRRA